MAGIIILIIIVVDIYSSHEDFHMKIEYHQVMFLCASFTHENYVRQVLVA